MDEGGSGRIRRMMCTRRGLLLLPMPRGRGFPLAMRRLRIRLRMSGIYARRVRGEVWLWRRAYDWRNLSVPATSSGVRMSRSVAQTRRQ